MAITEVPPPQSAPPEPPAGPKFRRRSARYDGMEPGELLHLIDSLEDERSRARVREGIYVSLLAHVVLFLFILFGPRYILHQPKVISPFDVLKERQQRELTYMSLPPDALKNIRPKNPQALSDKNRVAQTPHPTLDRKTIEQLQAMRRAGPPVPRPAPQEPPTPSPQQAPQQEQPRAAPPQQQAQLQPLAPTPQGTAPAPKPQTTQPNFNTSQSAGDAIRQAARGAQRPQPGGDFGANQAPQHPGAQAGLEVLSDTMGVDFGPYLKRVYWATYNAWVPIIPVSVQPPISKHGRNAVIFKIMPDGSVKEMQLLPSGDVPLDRTSWGSITGASPYPPLPKEFKGPYLALKFTYSYNEPDDR